MCTHVAEAKLRGLPKVWGRAALHLRLTRNNDNNNNNDNTYDSNSMLMI